MRLCRLRQDLKPGNILIDESGSPHIGDFGISRTVSDADVTMTK
jgi:serine/threonine protein kinase